MSSVRITLATAGAMVQLLDEHPDLRPCFPIADQVDLAVRWGA